MTDVPSAAPCSPSPTRRAWSTSPARWPRRGVELVSTGGTAKALRDAGLAVQRRLRADRLSGDDGRARQDAPPDGPRRAAGGARRPGARRGDGRARRSARSIWSSSTSTRSRRRSRKGAARDEVIENIDIGGPSMVRSAAKNHAHVAIVTDPADYAAVIAEVQGRRHDARDAAAAGGQGVRGDRGLRCGDRAAGSPSPIRARRFPATLPLAFTRAADELRYGENPHQAAALYLPRRPFARGIGQAAQVQGKALSLQQPQRRRRGAGAGRRVPRRAADGGDRQARQPVRRGDRRTRWSRRTARRSRATACRRSAASSRSTGRSTARRRRRSPGSSPRWWSRPMPTRTRGRCSRARRTCGCC